MRHLSRPPLIAIRTVRPQVGPGRASKLLCLEAALLASTALVGLTAGPAAAQEALPRGGQVVAGAASIAAGEQAVTIEQSSRRAVIAWDSFSLGQGMAAHFVVPDAGGATLNRVTSAAPSTIAGTITGNGQVFLINPNGIALTPTGAVSVGGGFVATTLDIADRDFMSGILRFAGPSTAGVNNAGRIEVGTGGFAALLGARVSHTGTISAPLGRIGLGSGQAVTLDLNGDGFLQVSLPSTATGAAALLEAGGSLSAARIELRAADAAELVRNTVNIPGHLRATGAHAEGGAIVIEGGPGSTMLTGVLDASSNTGGGGTIDMGGGDLALAGARVTADGASGGGTIHIGGGLGGAPLAGLTTARTLAIDAGTSVSARSNGPGDGGTIVAWAEDNARISGHFAADARGPAGDGGMVETSARTRLALDPGLTVSAASQGGEAGLWLIDPQDLTINATGAAAISSTLSGGTSVTATTSACNVSYGTCTGSAGDITLTSAITKSGGGNATLTLTADRNIILNAGISSTTGQLALALNAVGAISGSGNINTNGGLVNANPGSGSGTLSGAITGSGGLTKRGNGTLILTGANSVGGTTTVSGGTLVFAPSGSASYSTINVNGGSTGATLSVTGGTSTLSGILNLATTATDTAAQLVISGGTLSAQQLLVGNVSGASGSVTQSGGTLNLTLFAESTMALGLAVGGAGSYSLSAGTLSIAGITNVGRGGTGTFTQTGGTVNAASSFRGARLTSGIGTINLSGGTFNVTSGNLMPAEAGSGTITVGGSALVTLTNGLLYGSCCVVAGTVGTVNLNGGTIVAPSILPGTAGSSYFNFNGGTLRASAASTAFLQGLTGVTVQPGGAVIDNGSFAITVGQALSGTGGLNALGSGTLTLAGTNTFAGTTTVGGGTLQVAGDGNLGTAPGTFTANSIVLGGGTLAFTAGGTLDANRGITLTAASTLSSTGTLTYAGRLSGSGQTLTTTGGDLVLLNGTGVASNTNLTVGSGRLIVNGADALGTGSGLVQSGATLTYSGAAQATITRPITLASGGGLASRASGVTFANVTLPTAGSVTFNNDDQVTRSFTFTSDVALTGTLAIQVGGTNATVGTVTLPGVFSGPSGSISKSGTGTLILSGANSYGGTTTISAGTLQAGSDSALGSNSAVTVGTGATLDLAGNGLTLGSLAGAGTVTSSAATALGLTAGGNNSSTTFSGQIQNGSGTVALAKVGTGTLTLSGSNTYTGGTTIGGGTLKAGRVNAFEAGSAMTVASGATLDLGGFATSIGSLAGAGTVTNSSATAATLSAGSDNTSTTFSGVLRNGTGALALTKSGSGMLTLSGANTYTGATTVGAGTLALSGSWNVGSGTATTAVAAGATLTGTGTVTAARLAHSGAGLLSLSGSNALSRFTASGTVGAVQLNTINSLTVDSIATSNNPVTLTSSYGGTAANAIRLSGGATIATGGGAVSLTSPTGQIELATASILTGGGDLTLSGVYSGYLYSVAIDGNGAFTTPTYGVALGNATLNLGSGSGTVSSSRGMVLLQGTNAFTTSSAAGLALSGNVGLGAFLAYQTRLTTSGNVSLTGTVPTGGIREGLRFGDAVSITATSGTLSLTGNNPTGNGLPGVFFRGTSGTTLTAASGASIVVTGIAEGAGSSTGITSTTPLTTSGTVSFIGRSSATTGISLGNALTNASGTLTLQGTGVGYGTWSGSGLTIAAGSVNLDGSGTDLLAGQVSGAGALTKSGTGSLTLSGTNTYAGTTTVNAGTLTLTGTWDRSGATATTVVASGAVLNGGGTVAANALLHRGDGTLALTGSNLIGSFSTSGTVGAVTLVNAQSLGVGAIASAGAVVVAANGAGSDLTVNAGAVIDSSAGGTAVTLSAGRNFINLAGSNAVSAPNGRWLVFSSAPDSASFGNLDSGTTAVWNATLGTTGGSVSQPGNRYVFAAQPTLTFTSTSLTKTYGADAAASLTGAYVVSGYQPGVTGAFLGDSSATAWTGSPLVSSAGAAASAAVADGPYAITMAPGTVDTPSGYAARFASSGLLTVTPAPLLITARDAGKVYDGLAWTGGNGVEIAGLVNGESAANLAGTLSWGGSAQGANAAGTYDLVAGGLSSPNYAIAWNPGQLTIDRAALTITGNTSTSTYNGAPQTNGFTTSTLFGSDSVTGVSGLASGTNAGSYADSLSGATGTGLDNYAISYVNGSLSIGRAALTLTGADHMVTYDGTLHANGGAILTGVKGSDSFTVTGFASGTGAGTYSDSLGLIAGGGTLASNYALTVARQGVLTIDRAALTITGTTATTTYSGMPQTNGFTTSTLFGSDSVTGVSGLASGTAAGSYADSLSGATGTGLANYAISYVNGGLTIGRAALTLTYTASPTGSTYGAPVASLGGSVSGEGFVNGEGLGNLAGQATWTSTAAPGSGVGRYAISGSGLASGNYAISARQASGNAAAYTVTPAPVVLRVNDAAKVYDGLAWAGGNGVTPTGLVNGDSLASFTGSLSYGGSAQGATNAGAYDLSASGLLHPDYTITWQMGTLRISHPAILTWPSQSVPSFDAIKPTSAVTARSRSTTMAVGCSTGALHAQRSRWTGAAARCAPEAARR